MTGTVIICNQTTMPSVHLLLMSYIEKRIVNRLIAIANKTVLNLLTSGAQTQTKTRRFFGHKTDGKSGSRGGTHVGAGGGRGQYVIFNQ